MFAAQSQQALELVTQAQRILLVSHVSPDGDAIGSLLAMGQLLHQLGKTQVTLACDDAVPTKYAFLSGSNQVVSLVVDRFDLIVALDCSDERRAGRVYQSAKNGRIPVINIDHHVTNTEYGDINIYPLDAAATTEVLFRLAKAWNLTLDTELALCLLTGLVTATLCFRTANVTAQVMQVAAELMEAGADLAFITGQTVNRKSYNAIHYWGTLLETVQLEDRVVSAHASVKRRRAAGFPYAGDASLVSFLITAWEADVAVTLVETDTGQVEVSFRAKPGFDVSKIALELGGGGHPAAAGCCIEGPLRPAMARVLDRLREYRHEQAHLLRE